ncbi:MAG: PAS domain-containing protein [Rhodobacterales bacterium]|nr:MAG: PAS domain-containing protein [Rhodobacterales bacterium]
MRKLFGGKNVVSLAGYKKDHLCPQIQQLRAYWEGLRMGRLVPLRSEVDPRGIEGALSQIFLLERIAPGMARLRLGGQHLNDLLGMEVRGLPFTAFFTPNGRKSITETLEQVFDGPQIAELTLRAESHIGKPGLDGKLALFPLRSESGAINRAIGCLVGSGVIGRTPRRFHVRDQKLTALSPAQDRPAPQSRPVASPSNRAKPHGLRLVKSDECGVPG